MRRLRFPFLFSHVVIRSLFSVSDDRRREETHPQGRLLFLPLFIGKLEGPLIPSKCPTKQVTSVLPIVICFVASCGEFSSLLQFTFKTFFFPSLNPPISQHDFSPFLIFFPCIFIFLFGLSFCFYHFLCFLSHYHQFHLRLTIFALYFYILFNLFLAFCPQSKPLAFLLHFYAVSCFNSPLPLPPSLSCFGHSLPCFINMSVSPTVLKGGWFMMANGSFLPLVPL